MSYIEGAHGGCFEIFYADLSDCIDLGRSEVVTATPEDERTNYQPGWYWWACFPGCLPDGDAIGPFNSEELAAANALEVDQ